MKLPTWMHRKFRQGGTEALKEFHLGQPSIDDIHQHQKANQFNGSLRQVHREGQAQNSFAPFEITKLADLDEKTSDFSEYFDGFLAIGTFGTEAVISEPGTPTFAVSFEKLAEGETEVTENELRLISDELERVLAAETTDDAWTDCSARNSQVSNGRFSHAITVTLSGKPLEISESPGTENLICPLQEYLLGSAMEFPEKPPSPKKENRTSLGDLFEKHKSEEVPETKHKKGEKEGNKTAMNLMRKILKKNILHATSKTSSTTRETTESSSAETTLVKIMQRFQKKVHPECYISAQKLEKSHKNGIKDMMPCNAGHYKENHTFPDGDTKTFSERAQHNGHMRNRKSRSIPPQFTEGGNDSNGSRECWIKTDADYLVLEL